MCLSECDLGTYGDKCNETCGNCQDQTKCHHSNGTCLTGCSAGYDGALCKTRKYVKHCKYIYSKVGFRFILFLIYYHRYMTEILPLRRETLSSHFYLLLIAT